MSLVYLYIDDYRNFKKQNINFGDKYTFTYNEHTKELKKEENKLYIEDFYSVKNTETNTKISNVTGIVGANGSGKSSILSFLLGSSLKLNSNYGLYSFIMIYRSEDEYIVYSSDDLDVVNKTTFELKVLITKRVEIDKDIVINSRYLIDGQTFQGEKRTNCIYLSNIIDFNSFFSEVTHEETINLSSNKLIEQGKSALLKRDFIDKVRFISRSFNDRSLVPFDLPKELILTSSYDYWGEMSVGDSSSVFRNNLDYFKNEMFDLNRVTKKLTMLGGYEDGLCRIYYNSFLELLSSDLIGSLLFIEEKEEPVMKTGDTDLILDGIRRLIKQMYSDVLNIKLGNIELVRETILGFYDEYINICESFSFDRSSLVTQEIIQSRVEFLNDLSEIENIEEDLYKSIKTPITLDIVPILSFYFHSVIKENQYLSFKFRDLSSGEDAFLSIFSRFFSIVKRVDKMNTKNLTIILDEFDLYLHPHWQKKFLKTLIEFLTEIYIDRNIQIIFATNSPIPISDVLGYNMVFLETENGNSVVRTTLNEQHDTFAANIHTLYSDSFFVQDGLIGDLAKTKINEVISYLKDKSNENPFKSGTELRQFILQIGEPLIKNKLLTMYNDKYNLSIHERLEEIEKKIGLDNDKY